MKEIILGAGCFWGTQAFFDKINGIVKTEVGYVNGVLDNVTYEQVCRGNTGFIEVCKIWFDETKITLEKILNKFFEIIDPTIENRQGNDIGTQYQSSIFYLEKDKKTFENSIFSVIKNIQSSYDSVIKTRVDTLKVYIKAEEYHQKYLDKNPTGYCHIDLSKANND
ncbi:peptide methionine sulfoxide reductase MsrA/MsrB [Spiroplasma litorale]|uniref:Peptide methionine sulfoxide reductase MsrA n=1 Tax=Spiroplasma litorale TaxID=216942 RepID=A0A0K1W110_9MOLU|nr:peptide-methionine (S)-S-oxide reductase MsrA [Spiroplasma litorale]AKX33853.1 peptide methionine sulfoxide reductase MsrA/MsrB [Spiroplasma litorale]